MRIKEVVTLAINVASVAVAAVAVGYSVKAQKRVTTVCDQLDVSIDKLSKSIDVNVEEGVVKEAVNRAVDVAVRGAVSKATRDICKEITADIRPRVRSDVDSVVKGMKPDIKKEVERLIGDIDISAAKEEVIEKASEEAKKKFDVELERVATRFNNDLESSSKIYKMISEKLS